MESEPVRRHSPYGPVEPVFAVEPEVVHRGEVDAGARRGPGHRADLVEPVRYARDDAAPPGGDIEHAHRMPSHGEGDLPLGGRPGGLMLVRGGVRQPNGMVAEPQGVQVATTLEHDPIGVGTGQGCGSDQDERNQPDEREPKETRHGPNLLCRPDDSRTASRNGEDASSCGSVIGPYIPARHASWPQPQSLPLCMSPVGFLQKSLQYSCPSAASQPHISCAHFMCPPSASVPVAIPRRLTAETPCGVAVVDLL